MAETTLPGNSPNQAFVTFVILYEDPVGLCNIIPLNLPVETESLHHKTHPSECTVPCFLVYSQACGTITTHAIGPRETPTQLQALPVPWATTTGKTVCSHSVSISSGTFRLLWVTHGTVKRDLVLTMLVLFPFVASYDKNTLPLFGDH